MKKLTSLLHHVPRITRRFKRTERGAVAVMVALAVIPLMVAGGLALDLSRAYLVKSRLSHALDAAGLAVGSMRTTTSDPSYLETQFNSYFTANYAASEIGTTHDLTFVDNGGIITVTGQTTVDTVFMSVIGINNITVSSSAEITVETNGLELVMVLDNTGSMSSSSKMTNMKVAALDLIDILFGDETAPDLLKVALVPFDNTVNIGTGNVAYINPDPTTLEWGITSWAGCVKANAYPDDVQDSSTSWQAFLSPDRSANDWIQPGPTYYNKLTSSGWWDPLKSPNAYCPRPITPLTNNRATLEAEIGAMQTLGSTHINVGAVWGWRVLSPGAPFTEGASYSDPDWNKAAIILTDGDNTMIDSYYSAYGLLGEGNLGTTNSTSAKYELNDRLQEICTGMKNNGIIVYTIAFGTSISSSTTTMMENCATSADNYYESPDSATLSLAFRAIGAELKNLHLSQ